MSESYVNPQPGERLRVTFGEGKYTIIQTEAGDMRFLRNGLDWEAANNGNAKLRHLNILLVAAQEIEELRERIKPLEEKIPN